MNLINNLAHMINWLSFSNVWLAGSIVLKNQIDILLANLQVIERILVINDIHW